MTGEPVVFIPGLMADARLFLPQMVRLGAARPTHVLLPTMADTVEQMSDLALPGLPAKFALVGHGLGGDLALDIIRRIPDRVTRVALLATDPLSEPPQVSAAREARMVAARSGRLAEAIADEIPATALADTPWRDEILAELSLAHSSQPTGMPPSGTALKLSDTAVAGGTVTASASK